MRPYVRHLLWRRELRTRTLETRCSIGGAPLQDIEPTRELGAFEVEFTVTAPVGAEWTSFSTPLKAVGQLDGEQGRWRQHGLIFTSTPVGVYQVESEYDHPGEDVYGELDPDAVSFTVLAHDIAHDLGRPSFGGLEGSFICP